MVALFAFTSQTFSQKEEKFKVDTKKSTITWYGRKYMGSHEGTVNFKSGELVFKDRKLVSGSFIVDMNTIANKDIDNKDQRLKLETHLKGDDFFNAAQYPEAKLVFTNIDRKLGNDYYITAKLTVRGKTSEMKIPTTIVFNGNSLKVTVTCSFDRSKHDVKFGSESFFANIGDKIIYNDVDLVVYIEADK